MRARSHRDLRPAALPARHKSAKAGSTALAPKLAPKGCRGANYYHLRLGCHCHKSTLLKANVLIVNLLAVVLKLACDRVAADPESNLCTDPYNHANVGLTGRQRK